MTPLVQSTYDWLYRDLSLRWAGLAVGLLLLALHLYAFFNGRALMDWLKTAPRDKKVGVIILTIDLFWALLLVGGMDLGEFWKMRKWLFLLLPLSYALMIVYVDEFLTARAIGILLLLAACPLLDAAFLELPVSRLLLPVLAYIWILLGMFWVGMPYLMRDHVQWVSASDGRWKRLTLGGAAYGAVIIVCALVFWGR